MDSDGRDDTRRRAVAGGPSVALDRTVATPVPGELGVDDAATAQTQDGGVGELVEPAVRETFEGYVVLERLGEGGMGVVYLAHDPTLDRKVALKLLRTRSHDGGERAATASKVLREAQAMAKLSHPNVVSVYQVGIHGAAVFIAMEYVDGMTLSAWVSKQPRTWREIVNVLIKAGRGLEAAHRADIVHRDFKPDNVLIGHDGKNVRVSDFGLARMQGAAAPSSSTAGDTPILNSVTGQLQGTPVYMAPEQHRGERVDARADQFSFCVTLYEALFSARPFSGDTYAELAVNVATGVMRPIPATPKIPRYVRAVLTRGLSVDPKARYPSMTALLADLDRSPSSRRNVLLAVVGIAGIGIGATSLVVARHNAPSPCSDSEEKLATVWNKSKRDAITEAFAATKLPYAELARTSVFANIDGRAAAWTKMHRDACQATRVRGEQSEALLDRRMLCLDHQRAELSAFLDLLAAGGKDIVQNAVVSVRQLPSLDICADADALMSGIATPQDPAVRAEIETMQRDLRRGRVMLTTAHYDEGLTLAKSVVERATRIGYVPVEAEGLLLEGLVESAKGQLAKAEDLITQAGERADAARADRTKASALVELVYVVGYNLGQPAKAELLIRLARAAVARLGNPPELAATLDSYVGVVRFVEGKYNEALAAAEKSLETRRRVFGDEHPDVAAEMNRVGSAALRAGDIAKAFDYHRRAIATTEKVLGADHPRTAEAVNNLGNVYATNGDVEAAEQHYRKALEIWTKTLGPRHAATAIAVTNLAALALTQRDYARAIAEFQKALEIERAALGAKHPTIAETLATLAQAQLANNETEPAIASLKEAVEIWSAGTRVPAEGQVAKFRLAQALWQTGDKDHARALAHEAQSALVAEGGVAADSAEDIAAWLAEIDATSPEKKRSP